MVLNVSVWFLYCGSVQLIKIVGRHLQVWLLEELLGERFLLSLSPPLPSRVINAF